MANSAGSASCGGRAEGWSDVNDQLFLEKPRQSFFFHLEKRGEKREEDCIKMEEVGEIYEIISASLV